MGNSRGPQPHGFLWMPEIVYTSSVQSMSSAPSCTIESCTTEPPLPMLIPLPPSPQPSPDAWQLPAVIASPIVSLPKRVSLAARPGPKLPTKMANKEHLPISCFNPFEDAAPRGTFESVCKKISKCVAALLELPCDREVRVMHIHYSTIEPGARDLDCEMGNGGFGGFVIHTDRDVLLAGLSSDLARMAFQKVASERDASFVADEADKIAPLIRAAAEAAAGTFSIHDDFTARFGYSCGQVSALPTSASPDFLSCAIVRGGPCSVHFRNRGEGDSLGRSRAGLREELVESAKMSSDYFRDEWVKAGRPRVTEAFRTVKS